MMGALETIASTPENSEKEGSNLEAHATLEVLTWRKLGQMEQK